MSKRHELPRTIVYHGTKTANEKEDYINKLLTEKPWLDRNLLQWFKYDALKENFPLFVSFYQNKL